MTTAAFKPNNRWRGRGAPAVKIDPTLIVYLEDSYRNDSVVELPADPEDPDVKQLLRMINIYARRQNKSAQTQFFDEDGVSHLRFRLRDKRAYNRRTP